MTFPLTLRFKWLALAGQISVTDAAGTLVYYVRQRAFTLRESVGVFGDREQTRALYRIAADRIIDFSPLYRIADEHGAIVATVRRHGMRSLWRAHYEVLRDGAEPLTIREENPWVKVADGLLGQIPVVEFFTGYFLHPAYLVSRAQGGAPFLRLVKQAAFLEGRYLLHQVSDASDEERTRAVLAALVMVLLERGRG